MRRYATACIVYRYWRHVAYIKSPKTYNFLPVDSGTETWFASMKKKIQRNIFARFSAVFLILNTKLNRGIFRVLSFFFSLYRAMLDFVMSCSDISKPIRRHSPKELSAWTRKSAVFHFSRAMEPYKVIPNCEVIRSTFTNHYHRFSPCEKCSCKKNQQWRHHHSTKATLVVFSHQRSFLLDRILTSLVSLDKLQSATTHHHFTLYKHSTHLKSNSKFTYYRFTVEYIWN